MGVQAQRLRALLNDGAPFIAAEAYSALTGRIVQHVGFKAAYLGGFSCGAMHYAVPDIGILSQVEQIEQAQRIAAAIEIPLVVDADTLGETVADAYHFTRRYEQAGIAGFHVEDEINPKHSTYDGGLLPIADMQARLDACAQARQDPAFVIIARCDEFYTSAMGGGGSGSIPKAIERGKAYAEAGADLIVYPLANEAAHDALADALPIRFCTLGLPHKRSAFLISTGWGWSGAARNHLERARELFETGKVTHGGPLEGEAELLEKVLYGGLIGEWARKTGRKSRSKMV